MKLKSFLEIIRAIDVLKPLTLIRHQNVIESLVADIKAGICEEKNLKSSDEIETLPPGTIFKSEKVESLYLKLKNSLNTVTNNLVSQD